MFMFMDFRPCQARGLGLDYQFYPQINLVLSKNQMGILQVILDFPQVRG